MTIHNRRARVFEAQLQLRFNVTLLLSRRLVRLGASLNRYPSGINANFRSKAGLSKQDPRLDQTEFTPIARRWSAAKVSL